MSEERGHDLDRDAVAQPARGRAVTPPVGVESDPGPGPEPQDEVISGLIRPRVPLRLRPDVDEHVVAAGSAVLFVQVVGIQTDKLRPDRDRPPARLAPSTLRVVPPP